MDDQEARERWPNWPYTWEPHGFHRGTNRPAHRAPGRQEDQEGGQRKGRWTPGGQRMRRWMVCLPIWSVKWLQSVRTVSVDTICLSLHTRYPPLLLLGTYSVLVLLGDTEWLRCAHAFVHLLPDCPASAAQLGRIGEKQPGIHINWGTLTF